MRLMGIIENNGSFVVNIIKNNKYSSGYSVGLNYTFRNSENDLLDYINVLLKKHNIISNIKDNTLTIIEYKNLQKFCEFIDKYGNFISLKRQKEFLNFKEILNMYKNKLHLNKEGIKKIKNKKGELK